MIVTGVRWSESARRKKKFNVITMIGKPKTTQKLADDMGVKYTTPTLTSTVLSADNDVSRRMVEQCYRTRRTTLNPIIDWTDDDVWYYLNNVCHVPHCHLYDEGFNRMGCVGCPLATRKAQELEFLRFPRYKNLYLKAFDRMLKNRKNKSGASDYSTQNGGEWETAEDVYKWWIGT